MTDPKTDEGLSTDEHRRIGAALFNYVWTLLELDERTPEQVDDMIHSAHASAHHWRIAGQPVNWARSEWQCSRVYSVLERAEPALWHGRRCLELCEEDGLVDFDLAYAYEALARGYGVLGEPKPAAHYRGLAARAADGISEQDDRELFEQDLATLG